MQKKLFYILALFFVFACEVRQPKEKKRPATQEPQTVAAAKLPLPVPTPEPIKATQEPSGLDTLLGYTLPNATGLFVVDVKRVFASSLLTPYNSDISAMMLSDAAFRDISNKTGFNPITDVQYALISFRDNSDTMVVALQGSFDAQAIVKVAKEAPAKSTEEIEAVGPNTMIVGKSALLTEAKLAFERGALVDAPTLKELLPKVDQTRPFFAVYLPSASKRASAGSTIERAEKILLEGDPTKGLSFQLTAMFNDAATAATAKSEAEKQFTDIKPMLTMFGVRDPEAFVKSFTFNVVGTNTVMRLSLDEATALDIIRSMSSLLRGSGGLTPPPPPPPAPPIAPYPTPG